ncbi:MAG: hypothetical protein V3V85_01790 [Candidatus Thorarchaeota archaeon]
MDLDIELEALHLNCIASSNTGYVSQSQVGGVCGLLRKGLEDNSKPMQLAVLRILVGPAMMQLAGVEINSRKNLTSHIATTLIDQLLEPESKPWELSEYGQELLSEAEERAKEQASA